MPFLVRLVSCGTAVLVAVALVPGLSIAPGGRAGATVLGAAGVGAVFGLVNAGAQHLVARLPLPMYVRTLGLVTLATNAAVLAVTAWLTGWVGYGLRVDDVGSAVVGGFLVSVVAFVVETWVVARVESRRGAGRPSHARS